MSVHRRAYRPYEGPLTPPGRRWFALPIASFRQLFESRPLLMFLVLASIPVVVEVLLIHLTHNATLRTYLGVPPELFDADARFFHYTLTVQAVLSVFLVAWVGPLLVAPDLANGALGLYLSRPISRTQYVLGRLAPVLLLGSAITWLPGLLLFALESSYSGWDWMVANRRLALAEALGGALWIVLIAVLSVAVSVVVRWRIAATTMFLGCFLFGAAAGEAASGALGSSWGKLFNFVEMVRRIWQQLFGLPQTEPGLPGSAPWLVVVTVISSCLFLLNRRVRAREVVR